VTYHLAVIHSSAVRRFCCYIHLTSGACHLELKEIRFIAWVHLLRNDLILKMLDARCYKLDESYYVLTVRKRWCIGLQLASFYVELSLGSEMRVLVADIGDEKEDVCYVTLVSFTPLG